MSLMYDFFAQAYDSGSSLTSFALLIDVLYFHCYYSP
jgi:hypothetical protein